MKIKKLERNTTTLSIASFHEQNQLSKFNYDPPYQRHSVWSEEKQSYFIDSILRNYPIPPIFLHRKIDADTGKTSFDVIDGKQRLTAIARFINNEIPASNEYGPVDDGENVLDGAYFKELSSAEKLSPFKAAFWKYDIPIEYIDPTDKGLIEDVFDRLNRNGEPLTGQELRNAQYHSTNIIKSVNDLVQFNFLRDRLKITDLARMEDKEFCSECLLSVHLGQIIGSSQRILDDFYERFKSEDFSEALKVASKLCKELDALKLDYPGSRISGVSHLYGLWSVALIFHLNKRSIKKYKNKIQNFYIELRSGEESEMTEEYKKSMNSRTKERFMRVKRVNALLTACGEENLHVV